METPSSKLSEIVFDKLIEAKLLQPSDKQKNMAKFSEGKMNQEDWHFSIDTAIEKIGGQVE